MHAFAPSHGVPLTPVADLVNQLARLPGIGERSATRLVLHLLDQPENSASALARAIASLHTRVRRCRQCNNYAEEALCTICQDASRQGSAVCVVARVPDLWALESTGSFRGVYYVLGALLAPLEGFGPDDLPLDRLIELVSSQTVHARDTAGASNPPPAALSEPPSRAIGSASEAAVSSAPEVIVATPLTVEGEATALYIADALKRQFPGLAISRPAAGIPHGGELEFVDRMTLSRAFEARRALADS